MITADKENEQRPRATVLTEPLGGLAVQRSPKKAAVEVPPSKEGSLPGSTNFGRKSKAVLVGICVWSSSGVDSPNLVRAERGFRMDLRKRTSRQGETNKTKERSGYQWERESERIKCGVWK